jgi:hypothetical protein
MRILGLALLLCLAACAPDDASNATPNEPAVAQAPHPAQPEPALVGGTVEPDEPTELDETTGTRETTETTEAVLGEPVEPRPQPLDADPTNPSKTVHGEPVEPQPEPLSDKSTTGPQPARRAPEALLTQNEVYYGCNTPADCEVKNVGNCCGYYPACVNKDSPTFPAKVKAACAAEGSSSICGFQEIGGCDCIEGRCTAQPGPGGDLR